MALRQQEPPGKQHHSCLHIYIEVAVQCCYAVLGIFQLVRSDHVLFFFVFCYCVIPNTYIRFRSTLVPSLLAGISMTALQYGYIYLQVFLSSYNVIYGSLAAIPLFLLWLQISWAIVVFGALLCYTNQNLHHYDLDLKYDHVKLEQRIKVCAVVMHQVRQQQSLMMKTAKMNRTG